MSTPSRLEKELRDLHAALGTEMDDPSPGLYQTEHLIRSLLKSRTLMRAAAQRETMRAHLDAVVTCCGVPTTYADRIETTLSHTDNLSAS